MYMRSEINGQSNPEVTRHAYLPRIFACIVPLTLLLGACSDDKSDQTFPSYVPQANCSTNMYADANCNGVSDQIDAYVAEFNNKYRDSDFDGIPNSIDPTPTRTVAQLIDQDGDGILDYLDRMPGIDDYGDLDGDLVSNVYDPQPNNPNNKTVYSSPAYTPAEISGLQATSEYNQRMQELNAQASYLEVTNQIDEIYSRDSDNDGITNINDPYAYTPYYDSPTYLDEKREYEEWRYGD